MSTTPLSDDESAQWVRFTLKKLTHLAISARLIGPAALDAEGLLCDKRLCRDLDYMSSVIGGDLMYYTPRVLAVTRAGSEEDGRALHAGAATNEDANQQKKCRIIWTKRGKDGSIPRETEMGEYHFLPPNEHAIIRAEDEHEDAGLKHWELPRRKSRGAESAQKPVLLDEDEEGGDVVLGSGDVVLENGDVLLGNGDVVLGNGDVVLGSGDVVLKSGRLRRKWEGLRRRDWVDCVSRCWMNGAVLTREVAKCEV